MPLKSDTNARRKPIAKMGSTEVLSEILDLRESRANAFFNLCATVTEFRRGRVKMRRWFYICTATSKLRDRGTQHRRSNKATALERAG